MGEFFCEVGAGSMDCRMFYRVGMLIWTGGIYSGLNEGHTSGVWRRIHDVLRLLALEDPSVALWHCVGHFS